MKTVKITKKGTAWFNTGHPWIYGDDVAKGQRLSGTPGEIVNVVSEKSSFLAKAFYNPRSKIALRVVTRAEEEVDRDFWLRRIKRAADYREAVVSGTNACRLISSEADGLPGLVADRYGDVIVVQVTSSGMELIMEDITGILSDMFRPRAVVLRNDSPARKLEGLKDERKVLSGERPELVEVFEGEIRYLVDVWEGHKTGAYLDQRENRFIAGEFAHGRVLDAFCYQGLFSMHLANKAKEVISMDSSGPALGILRKNLELNKLRNVTAADANVFDRLREFSRTGEKFDCIVLDPPPFAKSKRDVGGARRGYRELNLRAMQCLNEGGYLATFSCSHNFSEEEFMHSVRLAAAGAGRDVRLVRRLFQSKDHPFCVTFPESYYLKGFVLQSVASG